jgi:hypothetical protein
LSDLYVIACERMAKARFNWEADPVYAILVDASYVPDFAAHTSYVDIPKSAVLLAPSPATSPPPTVVDGWCVNKMIYATQFGPAAAIHAVIVMQAIAGVTPHDTPPDDQLSLVAYIDKGYNFNEQFATRMALYIIWPDQGVFRP